MIAIIISNRIMLPEIEQKKQPTSLGKIEVETYMDIDKHKKIED